MYSNNPSSVNLGMVNILTADVSIWPIVFFLLVQLDSSVISVAVAGWKGTVKSVDNLQALLKGEPDT